MFISKIQTVGVVCLAAIVLGGGGMVTYQTLGAQPPAAPKATNPAKPQPAPDLAIPVPADEDELEFALAQPGLSAAKVDSLLKASTASDKMKTLLKDRYSAAVVALEVRWKEFLFGRGTLDILCSTSERLLRAETEIATNKADRILALQSHLRLAQEMEHINKARFDAGRLPVSDWKQTEFLALDAEIALERVKSQKE
jgi:hypothetical protein